MTKDIEGTITLTPLDDESAPSAMPTLISSNPASICEADDE